MAAKVLKFGNPFGHSLPHIRQISTNSYHSICSKPNRIRRRSLVSFCTATDASPPVDEAEVKEQPISEAEEEEKKIKDAADLLDIRVGLVLKAWRHDEADSLYVEEVDIGEPEPRIICSGLVKYIPIDDFQERKVVVLANLKPRNMRGVKSGGMLMALPLMLLMRMLSFLCLLRIQFLVKGYGLALKMIIKISLLLPHLTR